MSTLILTPKRRLGLNISEPGEQIALQLFPFVRGEQGLPGATAAKYVHTQSSPDTTWTVNHNLGVRPVVALFSAGYVEIEAGIVHTSINQFVVSFNTATGGFAVCQ